MFNETFHACDWTFPDGAPNRIYYRAIAVNIYPVSGWPVLLDTWAKYTAFVNTHIATTHDLNTIERVLYKLVTYIPGILAVWFRTDAVRTSSPWSQAGRAASVCLPTSCGHRLEPRPQHAQVLFR